MTGIAHNPDERRRLASDFLLLCAALMRILEANDAFRRTMPPQWNGDPIDDACKGASAFLATIGIRSPTS